MSSNQNPSHQKCPSLFVKLGSLLLYRKLLGNGVGSCFGIFFVKIWWWFFRTTKILTPQPKSTHFHKKQIIYTFLAWLPPPVAPEIASKSSIPAARQENHQAVVDPVGLLLPRLLRPFANACLCYTEVSLGVCLLEIGTWILILGGVGYWVM